MTNEPKKPSPEPLFHPDLYHPEKGRRGRDRPRKTKQQIPLLTRWICSGWIRTRWTGPVGVCLMVSVLGLVAWVGIDRYTLAIVRSDSMEATLYDGELVLLRRIEIPGPGFTPSIRSSEGQAQNLWRTLSRLRGPARRSSARPGRLSQRA